MFNGERVVVEKERMTRDGKFLFFSGAIPWLNRATQDFPLFTRNSSPREVDKTAEAMTDFVLGHMQRTGPLRVRFVYRTDWEQTDAHAVSRSIRDFLGNIHTQLKAYDVSRGLFGLRAVMHPVLFANREVIFDIQSGMTTHLGDGQRYHDGHEWTFSQLKGVRSNTGHIYFRGPMENGNGNGRGREAVFR